MASLSIDQKKLKILTQQVAGKHKLVLSTKSDKSAIQPNNLPAFASSLSSINSLTETKHLKRDLIRIFMLVTLALVAQVGIYWSLSKGWLFSDMS